MSYGLIYTVPFASLYNENCVVEIEKEGYSGEVIELTGGSSPFTVDIEDEEFLYTPTRFSTATIRIVGNDYLQSLFTIAYQQYRVTFKRNGVVIWCGFIKPELYTQDYTSETFELELECMSAMSSLEFIDYSQAGENRAFVSLWDLLKKCISSAKAQYEGVYIPHVYGPDEIEYTSENNVLEEMTISEQNFFDEDDKPMKLQEVLEEICKFLNWTCVDWRGDLYFVDIDHLGEYRIFDSVSFDWAGDTASPESNNIQRIGFAGSDNSLDILPGFNKVTVKTSNYPVGEVFSELDFKKMKDLVRLNDVRQGNSISHRILCIPEKKGMTQYTYNKATLSPVSDLNPYIGNAEANNLIGAIPLKYCNYELENGNPNITNYNYTEVIQIRQRKESIFSSFGAKDSVLSIKGATAVYSFGALSVSGSFRITINEDMSVIDNPDNYMRSTDSFKFRLRIGNKYYDGAKWVSDESVRFRIPCSDDGETSDYRQLKNTKVLTMPYSGLEGFIIPISEPLPGDIELTFYGTNINGRYPTGVLPYGILLKGFKVDYKKEDGLLSESDNSDRIYENIANENYINELDEIEFKISSYNDDGACYSKVMLGNKYLTNNLYSAIENTSIRPEEQLIRRIIKRYSAPRIKLTQEIKEESDLTPISRLSDNSMVNSRFINIGGTIDYAMNQFQCIMIEV